MGNFISELLGNAKPQELQAPVYEGYEFDNYGVQNIAMESYEDSLAVMEAVSDLYILTVRESSAEVLTEAAKEGVLKRIEATLTKLWGKIMAFFESIVRHLDSMVKSASDFAAKYEKKIIERNLSGFKFKAFKYTIPGAPDKDASTAEKHIVDVATAVRSAIESADIGSENAKALITKLREQHEASMDGVRGAIVKKGDVKAGEFSEELFAYFRGGAKTKEDKVENPIDIKSIIATAKEGEKLKAAIKAAKAETNKSFNTYIKDFRNAAKKVEFGEGEGKEAGSAAAFAGICKAYQNEITSTKSIMLQFYSAWISAVKERDNSYKSIMRSALSYTPGADKGSSENLPATN